VPINISQGKGKPDLLMSEDEEFKKINLEKVPLLRPAFKKDGK
jgi:acetyl-CoA C-acetyltransferase